MHFLSDREDNHKKKKNQTIKPRAEGPEPLIIDKERTGQDGKTNGEPYNLLYKQIVGRPGLNLMI
jgi:hypothetical protein